MQVTRLDPRVVTDADEVAFSTFAARFHDHAIGRSHDRRADRRAVVDSMMRAEEMENRVIAPLGETGGDPGEFERSAQELFAERGALRRVIAGPAVGLTAEGLVGLTVVNELRSKDGSVTDRIRAGELLVDDKAE